MKNSMNFGWKEYVAHSTTYSLHILLTAFGLFIFLYYLRFNLKHDRCWSVYIFYNFKGMFGLSFKIPWRITEEALNWRSEPTNTQRFQASPCCNIYCLPFEMTSRPWARGAYSGWVQSLLKLRLLVSFNFRPQLRMESFPIRILYHTQTRITGFLKLKSVCHICTCFKVFHLHSMFLCVFVHPLATFSERNVYWRAHFANNYIPCFKYYKSQEKSKQDIRNFQFRIDSLFISRLGFIFITYLSFHHSIFVK